MILYFSYLRWGFACQQLQHLISRLAKQFYKKPGYYAIQKTTKNIAVVKPCFNNHKTKISQCLKFITDALICIVLPEYY